MKKYNDILKDALWEIKEEEIVSLPEENEIDYEFSEDFKNKTKKLISENKLKKRRYHKVLKKVAVFVIVCLIALMFTGKTNASLGKIYDYIYILYENYLLLEYEKDSNRSMTMVYQLKYIPDGFNETGYKLLQNNQQTIYESSEYKHTIRFIQTSNIKSTTQIYSKEYKELSINGIDVFAINKSGAIYYFWDKDGYSFRLSFPAEVKNIIDKNIGNLSVREIIE